MLSRVGFYTTARDPLLYNEKKIAQDKARCIGAENFLKEHHQITLQEKFDRFDQRASLNDMSSKRPSTFHLISGPPKIYPTIGSSSLPGNT